MNKKDKQAEKQAQRLREEKRFEQERLRAEGGRKGAMRAFATCFSDSDSDMSAGTDIDDNDRAKDLGSAAPAAKGDRKYLEQQKENRERAKAKAKDREEKRKRIEEQEVRPEEETDVRELLSGMTPDDFHKVLLTQDNEIRQPKKDREEERQERRRQTETNAVISKVITAQGAAQKKSEEAAVLYCCELTGLPRDDAPEHKREFVMWCTEQAGIPNHEITSIEYTDVRRRYGIQTAIVKFGNKGNRTKMSQWMQFYKAWNLLKYYSVGVAWEQHRITGRYQETADQRERGGIS